MTLSVLICRHPPRPKEWLQQALASIDLGEAVIWDDPEGHIGHARARGLGAVSSDYVAILDDDDELMPGALAACVHALNALPAAPFAYTRHEFIGGPVPVRRSSSARPGSRRHAFEMAEHLVVYRKSSIEPYLPGIAEFRLMPERILRGRLLQEHPAVFVDRIGYRWRVHPGQTSRVCDLRTWARESAELDRWRPTA